MRRRFVGLLDAYSAHVIICGICGFLRLCIVFILKILHKCDRVVLMYCNVVPKTGGDAFV